MSLFIRKFEKFMRKNHAQYQRTNYQKKESKDDSTAWFNCGKVGHFANNCRKAKKDRKSVDKGKKPYERKHRSKEDRKEYIKKKFEALVANDSKSKWVESSDESSYFESSSNDEEVTCLTADDSAVAFTSEHVFDLSSLDFTRE